MGGRTEIMRVALSASVEGAHAAASQRGHRIANEGGHSEAAASGRAGRLGNG